MKSEHLPINTDNFTPNTQVVFICECGKHYKHSRSLWHHQKTCTFRKINVRPNFQMVMFTLDGAFDNRRARIVMIAHSKATVVFFRTSYHGHPGTSVFNRSIEGEYGHLKLGSYIYFPKGNHHHRMANSWPYFPKHRRRLWFCLWLLRFCVKRRTVPRSAKGIYNRYIVAGALAPLLCGARFS